MLDSWTMSSFSCRAVFLKTKLRSQRGTACIKYVPDYVVVPTLYVGDGMARKRVSVSHSPLLVIFPLFVHKNELRDPWHGDRASVRCGTVG